MFWCLDAVFRNLHGVARSECGYAGGSVPSPTYAQVSTKRTGHAEDVQVDFDPLLLSYEDLLRIFFTTHDSTTKDRQGADVGSRYRSAIFTQSSEPAHQDYYARNPWAGYCQMVVAPKVAKFRKQFTDRLRTPTPATA